MALEYGFYDAMNGDRAYSATQMSEIFEGLITDGVYASVGDKFFTTPGAGMQVIVGTGRAWFDATWNRNKAPLPLDIDQADPAFDRIDSVCIQVYAEDTVRENTLMIVKGNVAVNPEPPIFPATSQRVYWHRLANVRVRAGTTSIRASDIDIRVGSSECPFVTSIVQQTNIDTLFASWDEQFNDWWDTIKAVLDENVATNLQNQITTINTDISGIHTTLNAIPTTYVKVADKATAAEVQTGTNNTKWVTPATLKSGSVYWSGAAGKAVGEIVVNAGDVPNANFLPCDGRALSMSEYPTLFNLITLKYLYTASASTVKASLGGFSNMCNTSTSFSLVNNPCPGCALVAWVTTFFSGSFDGGNGRTWRASAWRAWGLHSHGTRGDSSLKMGDAYGVTPSIPTTLAGYGTPTGYAGKSTDANISSYSNVIQETAANYDVTGFFIDYTNTKYYVLYNTSTRVITVYEGSTATNIGTYTGTNYPIMFCGSVFWSNGNLQTYRPTAASNNTPVPNLTLAQYNLIKGKCVRHSNDFRTMLAIDTNGTLYKFTVPSTAAAGAMATVTQKTLHYALENGTVPGGVGYLLNSLGKVIVVQPGNTLSTFTVGIETNGESIIMYRLYGSISNAAETVGGLMCAANEQAKFAPFEFPSSSPNYWGKFTYVTKVYPVSGSETFADIKLDGIQFDPSPVLRTDNTFPIPYIQSTVDPQNPLRTAFYIKAK